MMNKLRISHNLIMLVFYENKKMNNKLGIVKFLVGVSIFIITLFIFFPLPLVYTCLYIKYSVNPSDITPEVLKNS